MRDFLLTIFADRQLRTMEFLFDYLHTNPLQGLSFLDALKKIGLLVLAFFQCIGVLVLDTGVTPYGKALDLSGYELVFEDNFDGDSLNLDRWQYRSSGKRSGGYMDPAQVRVEDGKLYIKAEHKTDGTYGEGWYSGMVSTKQEFIGGVFEISAIVSRGGGFWSAFWLNARGMESAEASNGGLGGAEIDIFEAGNYDQFLRKDAVSFNVHVGGYGDGLRSAGAEHYYGKNIYTEYNTYTLEWTQEEYILYVNGVEATRSTWLDGVSKAEEYIILSLETPKAEEFDEQPGFETEFLIDYVRVYQKAA